MVGRRSSRRLGLRASLPPTGLGVLPAAVEAAAYWIACEALTNVARHAAASTCQVRLARTDGLELEIGDDGRGLQPGRAGVGLAAMRERAEELGSTWRDRLSRGGYPGAGPCP